MESSEEKVVVDTLNSGVSGRGKKGKKGDCTAELPPHILVKLKKVFILPAKDIPLKLKKSWKMSKSEHQQGLACVVCGRSLSTFAQAQAHVQTKPHQLKQKAQQLQEYLPTIPKLSSAYLGSLTSFLTDIFHQHSAASQRDDRQSIAEQLEYCLKEDGLEVTVTLFGSSGSGFALTFSNVNLNISLVGATENQKVIADCMKSVAVSLKRRSDVYWNVQEDYFAFNKIPRILFQHKFSNLRCEVRAEAGNPAGLCSLLMLYAEIDERCVQLATLFRLWAKVCSVDSQENGHYPGHMFVVMVIHYLQQIGVLPVLHELYKRKAAINRQQSQHRGNAGSRDKVTHLVKTGFEEGGSEGGGGESEAVDDAIVFVEEGGGVGEEEVNENSNEGEEEESGSAKKLLAHAIDYLDDLSELPKLWQSTQNTQSLGELWYHLLRYYAVEFKIDVHAVSIRQKPLLLRQSRQWGDVRLAVEDPMIPKSNLGRCSSSQQVYDYLMSSLRLSALYFSGYSDQLPSATLDDTVAADIAVGKSSEEMKDADMTSISWPSIKSTDSESDQITQTINPSLLPSSHQHGKKDEEEGKGGEQKRNIEQQDSSILFASAPSEARSRDVMQKGADLSFLGDRVTVTPSKQSGLGDGQFSLNTTSDTTSRETSVDDESTDTLEHGTQTLTISDMEAGLVQSQDLLVSSTCDERSNDSSHSPTPTCPPSLPTAGGDSVVLDEVTTRNFPTNPSFTFSPDNFVFQAYPVSCLNCKKLKHSILDCPELDLASEYRKHVPKHLPAATVLKQIDQCFFNNMMWELPDEGHLQMRREILASILKDIRVIYPSAELAMFGSSANGFGSKASDLDICLTLPGHDKSARGKIIELIAAEFSNYKRKYEQIVPITSARVPIVKFYMRNWNMQCDISLENKLALRNTKLLAAYTRIDSRVPVLGCALKCLAKSCDVCDAAAGSLSSYAYVLMLLHYLQTITPPVIPVLQQLKPLDVTAEEHVIDDWDCYFYEFQFPSELKTVWSGYKRNKTSSGQLWLQMLRYYTTEFDWNQNVVSIKQLEPLSKFDKWWMGKCMCIEDPFNLDHNLGGGITNRMRAYILDRFMDALRYHSENRPWKSIRELMDPVALKGETRPPKFMRCHNCGNRGHKAVECNSKANQYQRGVQNKALEKTTKERNVASRPTVPRFQERLVYNVVPASQRARREKRPPRGEHIHQIAPTHSSGNHTLLPVNTPSSTHSVLPPSTMQHYNQPRPSTPVLQYPSVQYPPGMPGYATSSVPVPIHGGTVAPLMDVHYGHSNSYPLHLHGGQAVIGHHGRELLPGMHHASGQMVITPSGTPHHGGQAITPPPGLQHTSVLPHSVGRSPPYRQHQQPYALLQQPSQHSDGSLQTYNMAGYNPPVSYRHSTSAPANTQYHASARPVYLHDSRLRGKRN